MFTDAFTVKPKQKIDTYFIKIGENVDNRHISVMIKYMGYLYSFILRR